MNRTVVCLLLLGLSSMANARDVRMHGPNGDGGALADSPAIATPAPTPAKHDSTTAHAKVKTPPLFRSGDDDGGSRTPRWHSFLPGMFR
ncbi:hypothetical protein [Cognatiluteimonas profundi]|uniref:hypothetical protein n=1 Tax=Cognatiluteimonas profundi TaxID=2594501 RepID=UPI00131C3DC9|nr:hypothetical protein [Lysobacter profundi]